MSELEREFIDTPPFQRLRKIKQLATTYLVYHGAEHTRFGHSIGVMHLTSAVFDSVMRKNVDLFDEATSKWYRQILRLIGLTHDLGHAPFSHASEILFEGEIGHEDYTRKILLETEVAQCIKRIGARMKSDLGAAFDITPELIWLIYDGSEILNESYVLPDFKFLKSFMDGELDCDKMDYLLRDSYYCGVKYGSYDLGRLVDSFTVFQKPDESTLLLAIDHGGVHAVEEFILARYFMFLQVYFHKTRRVLDYRLVNCMKDILPNGKFPLDVNEYMKWDDSRVFSEIEAKRGESNADAFLRRQTISCVFSTKAHIQKDGQRASQYLERVVKERLESISAPKEALWVDRPTKAVHGIAEDPYSEKALPVVLKHQDEPVSILEESLLLSSLNKPIAFDRFCVAEEYKENVQAVIREYNDAEQ
jgi:HD superfamily phosphohydrolase